MVIRESLCLIQKTKKPQGMASLWELTTMNGKAVPTRKRLNQSREPQIM